MESKILEMIGIDPAIILIALSALILVLLLLVWHMNMKYNRLKKSYNSFMRGKDGKSLEDGILDRLDEMDRLKETLSKSRTDIHKINEEMKANFQKAGIVKYDAFHEMGGKLSFAFTLLDGNNNGYIINSMHSREGCYNYIKEIVKGESYIELSEEEAESLERAIFREDVAM